MRCEECIYYPKCEVFPFDESGCGDFKHRTNFPEIPCMVGTTVYIINRHLNRIFESVVIGVKVGYTTDLKNHIKTCWTGPNGNQSIRKWSFRQVGRYVFFTREEAEKALEEGAESDGRSEVDQNRH